MSYFGITALGPPNNFQSGLVNALGLNVFTEDEFKCAFAKMDKDGSQSITPDEVEDLLFETYGFPPLEEEVAMFMQAFDTNQDGKVTWDEFCAALSKIRDQVKSQAGGAKEFQSWEKMRSERYKHVRMAGELQQKYKVPMTSSQGIGFYHQDEQ